MIYLFIYLFILLDGGFVYNGDTCAPATSCYSQDLVLYSNPDSVATLLGEFSLSQASSYLSFAPSEITGTATVASNVRRWTSIFF